MEEQPAAPKVITFAVDDMKSIAERLKEIEKERQEALNRQSLPQWKSVTDLVGDEDELWTLTLDEDTWWMRHL